MEGVTIVDHPLVQHKLTLIRDKSISTKSFRELLKEIGMLLCYEVTRDLPLAEVVIETPLAQMHAAKIAGWNLRSLLRRPCRLKLMEWYISCRRNGRRFPTRSL